ncbi:MAG TPA: transglycosylase SLT domain-containing protein [Candidatus Xenobia bacterium]
MPQGIGGFNPMMGAGMIPGATAPGAIPPTGGLDGFSPSGEQGLGGSQGNTSQLTQLIQMLMMEIQQLEQQLQQGANGGGASCSSCGSNPISGLPSLGGGGGGGSYGGGGGGGCSAAPVGGGGGGGASCSASSASAASGGGSSYDGSSTNVSQQDLMSNVKAVAAVAQKLGVDPQTAVATMLTESGGNNKAVGDGGTSFGLFQLHQGGELGNLSQAQADDPTTNATVALTQFAQTQKSTGLTGGALAAAAQRPANPGAYAQTVNGKMGEAGSLLKQAGIG